MKTAVVTGADGFLGNCLAKHLLKKGYKVIGVGLDEKKVKNIESADFSFINAKFEEYINLKAMINCKIDYFFHFAWNGVFGEKFKDYSLQFSNSKVSNSFHIIISSFFFILQYSRINTIIPWYLVVNPCYLVQIIYVNSKYFFPFSTLIIIIFLREVFLWILYLTYI